MAWLSIRSATVRKLVKSEPTLLLYRGQFLDQALHQQRITEAEICAAVRAQGIGTLAEVEAVVLETDGSFSTVRCTMQQSMSALALIANYPPDTSG